MISLSPLARHCPESTGSVAKSLDIDPWLKRLLLGHPSVLQLGQFAESLGGVASGEWWKAAKHTGKNTCTVVFSVQRAIEIMISGTYIVAS